MLPKTFNPAPDKEKKTFPKFLKVLIVFLIIVFGLGYLFFYSSIFKIKNIIIDGMSEDSQAILEKYKGRNIFLTSSRQIQNELGTKFAETEKVKIQKGLPDTIKISAESFQPKMVWQSGANSYLVNAEGRIFKEFDGTTDLPIVEDSNQLPVKLETTVVSTNFIEFIQKISAQFFEQFGFQITKFQIEETIFQVWALTDKGWFIKFDTTRSVDEQLEALKQLLVSHKDEIQEYVDVRVEGRVYFK